MKKVIITLIIGLSTAAAFAQQEAMFTHYMFNTLAVNPGYAGSRDALTVTGLHRSQWVGFDGAPTTQTLTVHSPFAQNKMGVGLSLVNDRIGPLNNTSLYVDFAYRLKVNEKATLAMGLKGGFNMMKADFNDLPLDNPDDPTYLGGARSQMSPNLGFGLYYFTTQYYLGLSTPKIVEHSLDGSNGEEKRHYYFIGGTVFDLGERVKLKPTTFVKLTEAAPMEADLTATFILDDRFWAGAMFRTGDAAGLLLGANLTQQLSIGYSFDFSYTNTTFKYNAGSHELMLRYDFLFGDDKRVVSPRYF